jgi:hypothetical protein
MGQALDEGFDRMHSQALYERPQAVHVLRNRGQLSLVSLACYHVCQAAVKQHVRSIATTV